MGRETTIPLFAKSIYMYLIDTFFYVKMVCSNYFPAKVLILSCSNGLFMAGVLERIRWPQKKLVCVRSSTVLKADLRVLELKAAKEILAEVFKVRVSDVEEMILNRYDEICYAKPGHEETEQWPREFMLE